MPHSSIQIKKLRGLFARAASALRTRRAGALAALACAFAVGACGGKVLNTAELEDELRQQLAPQGGVSPEEISVACPDDQKVEKGRRFSCTLTAPNGDEVRVDVTLTDDEGGFRAVVPRQ